MSEHACGACSVQWTHEPAPGMTVLGWGVVTLGAATAIGMLVLIHRENTGWGGIAGAGAMLCLGLGMWLLDRASPRCPECGRRSAQSPPT